MCWGIEGAGDNSLPVGYSLLADYVISSPQGHAGSAEDSCLFRFLYSVVRLGSNISPAHSRSAMPIKLKCSPLSLLCHSPLSLLYSSCPQHFLMSNSYIERELNVQYTMVLVLQTVGLVLGYVLGDVLYLLTDSLQWSIAIGGALSLPMFPVFLFLLPETLPEARRAPLSCDALVKSLATQWLSVSLFASNTRLWGLALTQTLIGLVSSGVFDGTAVVNFKITLWFTRI